ncbi:Mur ligase family protein [Leuconostocaceae bacterium ESL0958]|nr:Mur ligase family protein [Leuconostocaceae bacterium ESL0958]
MAVTALDQAIRWLHQRPKRGQRDSLAPLEALLEQLGQPERRLPKVIHITGTNGKGSTATMIAAMAQAAGLRTGLFISPYVVDFRERIQIDGQPLPAADLLAALTAVQAAVQEVERTSAGATRPAEFEVLTAAMYDAFARADLDLAIIEVGIGGLYDSTNVLPGPSTAVVTSIALDHQALLGRDLAAITRQKAGIIKAGGQLVLGPDLPAVAERILVERAQEKGAMVVAAKDYLQRYPAGLPGHYQQANTATAVAAFRTAWPAVSDSVIKAGLAAAHFPGRFEQIKPGIYLDGAHNAAGLTALLTTIKAAIHGPVTLILASLADKNIKKVFRQIIADPSFTLVLVRFTGPDQRPGLGPTDLAGLADLPWYDDFQAALADQAPDQTVVLAGSLYFVSEVRSALCKKS